MNGLPLDHVAIAVTSIEDARSTFEHLTGERCSEPEEVTSQAVKVAFVGMVELIEPTDPDSGVARFLEKRGGLHHIAYRTDDIAAELARLVGEGFEPIDTEPRPGASGHRVAFLHPRSTGGVLVELVQRGE